MSILIAEQNANMALQTTDWGYVIAEGKIVRDAESGSLARDPGASSLFGTLTTFSGIIHAENRRDFGSAIRAAATPSRTGGNLFRSSATQRLAARARQLPFGYSLRRRAALPA